MSILRRVWSQLMCPYHIQDLLLPPIPGPLRSILAATVEIIIFTCSLIIILAGIERFRRIIEEAAKLKCKMNAKCEFSTGDHDDEREVEHVGFPYTRPSEKSLREYSSEFYEIVSARRSLRFFSRDSIPKSVIRNIIRAAGTSPSGAHTQPWTFVAVSNADMKQSIRIIVEHEEEINYKKRMGAQWTNDLKPLKTDWHKEYLTDAPWLILVFRQDHGIRPNGQRKTHYYKETSVAIACGILITAIQYTGLVTLTSTPLNCGATLRELLGRPDNEKLVLLLPVGFPAKDATVPALKRKSLEEILVEVE